MTAGAAYFAWPRSESRDEARAVALAAPGGRAEEAWNAAVSRLARPRASGGGPAATDALVERLATETDERALFQVARALQRRQTPEVVRRTVDVLRSLPPDRLGVGVHAILGRREPEAVAFAADVFLDHPDPVAQAKAAFVLAEVAEWAPRAVMRRAIENVRAPSTPAALRVESLDLLGAQPLSAEEQEAVVAAFEQSTEPEVRNAALRAGASGGIDRAQLRAMFETAAADPSMPAEMREAARLAAASLAH